MAANVGERDYRQREAQVPGDVRRADHDQDGREQASTHGNQPTGESSLLSSSCRPGQLGARRCADYGVLHVPRANRPDPSRYSGALSRLSDVQFSRFTETEVAKLLTFGRPRGALEVMVPMSDDERRDLETHLKEHFRLSLAMQVKATHVLYQHGRISRLQKRFSVKRERLIDDLYFWYFFGFMDLATAAFRAPVFLVPSHVVHAEAVHEVHGNIVEFDFVASMNPSSNDRWRPYACDPAEVAGRVVKFLKAHEGHRRAAALGRAAGSIIVEPGTILVARAA